MYKALALVIMGFAVPLAVPAADTPSPTEGGRLKYMNILQGTDSHFELSHGNTLPWWARLGG